MTRRHCEEKLHLAVDIVREHFGVMPGLIVERAVFKGPSTLVQLARYCQQNIPQGIVYNHNKLRRSVLVLVHHGILDFKLKAPPVYFCNPDAALLRIRHPRVVIHAKELFGDIGSQLIKLLLQHGRMPLGYLIDLYIADPQGACGGSLPEAQQAAKIAQLTEVVEQIIAKHYIEYCPKAMMTPMEDGHQKLSGAEIYEKMEGSKRGKTATSSKKRTKLEPENEEDLWNTDKPDKSDAAIKTEDIQEDEDGNLYQKELRVNAVQFLQYARGRCCVDLVFRLVNEHAASVVETILSKPLKVSFEVHKDPASTESCVPSMPSHSQAVTMDELTAMIRSHDTQRRLPDIVDSLQNPFPQLGHTTILRSDRNGIAVNMEALITAHRNAQMEFLLSKQFGPTGRRIYKLLNAKKVLEERDIIANALAGEQEVRVSLFRMKVTEYLYVREVPTALDRNPKSTLFLWHLPPHDVVRTRLVTGMYKNLRNLYQRRQIEYKEIEQLLTRAESSWLTEDQSEKMEKWNSTQDTIALAFLSVYESALGIEYY